MEIARNDIDGGKAFDWGRTSDVYAKYRDIYPREMYEQLIKLGIGVKGQRIFDLGTGTGVIPRNMYRYGAEWTGVDSSEKQIAQARLLAKNNNMDIRFLISPVEDIDMSQGGFDVITACQCFWYFDHNKLVPKLHDMLKDDGKLAVIQMGWLPDEDRIAGLSEKLVLEYSPEWTGAGWTRQPVYISDEVLEYFDIEERVGFDIKLPFTRESWNGRMKSCRGIGASLSDSEIAAWEREHRALLILTAPEEFEILHHVAIAVLKKK